MQTEATSPVVRIADAMTNLLIFLTCLGFGRAIAIVRSESLNLKEVTMLWTIFVILLVMWLLGMATSYTLGGFIHILLILAIAAVLIRIIQGRTPV